MEVGIETGHADISRALVREVNQKIAVFTPDIYHISSRKYESLIRNKNISIWSKKQKLVQALHDSIIKTVSIDPEKESQSLIDDMRANVRVIREIIFKLKSINHYIDEVLLTELGIKKAKKTWKNSSKKTKEKSWLEKADLQRFEHSIHSMISKVITLDESLLKKYQKKETKVIRNETVKIKDIEKILGKETELLMHLEAKFPPPNHINEKILEKENFNHWVSITLTSLSGFKNYNSKEILILKRLNKNRKVRKKIQARIEFILKEKFKLMEIKEQRVLSWEHVGKIEDDLHVAAHKYLAASQL